MADFCNQCAKDLGFPEGDLKVPEDRGPGRFTALCEGCGPTIVDEQGNCLHIPCNEPGRGAGIPKDAIFYIPLPKPKHTSDHYKGLLLEPIDIIDIWNLDFVEGNILKYLFRYRVGGSSTPAKDVEKLEVYAKWLRRRFERSREIC